jgi:predicted nucleic acid-binding protein
MGEVLIDTDVLVDHLRGARALDPAWGGGAYSIITRCELFAGTGGDETAITQLLASLRELPIERHVAEEAGRIRRATRIPAPDALIGATAMAHNLELATRNRRHFEQVQGLRLALMPQR